MLRIFFMKCAHNLIYSILLFIVSNGGYFGLAFATPLQPPSGVERFPTLMLSGENYTS